MTKPSAARPRGGTQQHKRRAGGDSAAARQVAKRMASRGGTPPRGGNADRRPVRRPARLGGPPKARPRRLPRPRLPAAPRSVLTVLVVAVLVVAGTGCYVGYELHQARTIERARAEAQAVAGRYATEILSYDYRRLNADFAAAKNRLTDDFAREYADTTERVVREKAEQYEAVVKAEPVAVSVVSAEPDTVHTLLFVNQTTTSNQLDGPKADFNRIQMTLRHVDGTWLVSSIDAL